MANYLIGKGEKLTEIIDRAPSGGEKIHPYSLGEAKAVIGKRAAEVAREVAALPATACPNDEAVAVVTLNPAYLAKTSFPETLLAQSGLRAIGSRQVEVTPRKIATKSDSKKPEPTATVDVFVAGQRSQFKSLSQIIPRVTEDSPIADDLIKIEDFRVVPPEERIQSPRSKEKTPLMEFVLHTGDDDIAPKVRQAFKQYLKTLGVEVDLGKRIDAGHLSFVAVRIPRTKVNDAAKFSFLRTTRDMPKLRQLRPAVQDSLFAHTFACSLPPGQPIDTTIDVAVFDGGVPDIPALKKCVVAEEPFDDLAAPVPEFVRHGLAVTSALLFGPLPDGKMAPQPYARVHHYRVLDENTERDPQDELYPVLRRILRVLEGRKKPFDFVNLSIGPDIPMDDNEIHPWTAALDPHNSAGKTLACAAVGNTGQADAILRYNRVQPPSDGVNIVAVGACDSEAEPWKKTIYSSVGYGRAPGFVKPDGLERVMHFERGVS